MTDPVSAYSTGSLRTYPIKEDPKSHKQVNAADKKKVNVLAKKRLGKKDEEGRALPPLPKASVRSTSAASEKKAANASLEYKRGSHAESSPLKAKRPKQEEAAAAPAPLEKEPFGEELLPKKVEKALQTVSEDAILSSPPEKRSELVDETSAAVSLDQCKQRCDVLVGKIKAIIVPSLGFVKRKCLDFYIDYQLVPHLRETRTHESLATLLEGPSQYLRDPSKTKDVNAGALKEILDNLDEIVATVKRNMPQEKASK